ncbi:hypothetical protein GA0070564_1154 [Micromonospora mirobrigensis]|uniref:Uncharacterized protein n=1 Tax=Micromonospora mirobrigensis TaxID=262898 RepID=A0A1C5ANR9_9ACTN|nr:hypothetical protein GA0070564_1154 [Micromonospora mirobrigensis]
MSALSPSASGTLGRYESLVAKGVIRLRTTTMSDIPRYDVRLDFSPLELLLTEREDDQR